MEAQTNYNLSPLICAAINLQLRCQMLELKLFGNHEKQHVSSKLLVLWAKTVFKSHYLIEKQSDKMNK